MGLIRTQMTLGEAFPRKYDRVGGQYQSIIHKLAVFIGSTNVPNSIVGNAEFLSLLNILCQVERWSEKRSPKCCWTWGWKCKDTFLVHKESTCMWIFGWKKGCPLLILKSPHIFFSRQDHRCHKVILAVKRMPHPHNAENIREILNEVLQEWRIPSTKVVVVITDTGSNLW